MRNSFLLTLTTLLTVGSIGFLTNPKQPIAKSEINIYSDTSSTQTLLDSIEDFKNTELVKYEKEIKNSFETIKDQEKKQEELSMSTDSIYNMVNINNTITKN